MVKRLAFYNLFFSLSLTTPVIDMVLLNSQNEQQTSNDTIKQWFELPNTTTGDQYEVTFNTLTSECTISGLKLYGNYGTWKIPSFIIEPNSQKKCRVVKLSIYGNYNVGLVAGNHCINVLDLSEAKFLSEISDNCFNRNKANEAPILRYVNFQGAINLRKIGKYAFYLQEFSQEDAVKFNPKFNDIDFSQTKIETIGERAFSGCCLDQPKYREWNNIYFPKTLQQLENYAFSNKDKKVRQIYANNIVLPISSEQITSHPNILSNDDCTPALKATGRHICCENSAQLSAWNNIKCPWRIQKNKNIDSTSLMTSSVCFAENGIGSTVLYGACGVDGYDQKNWVAEEQITNVPSNTEIVMELSNDYEGQIWLEKQKQLSGAHYKVKWKNTLKPGLYNFTIRVHYADYKSGTNYSTVISDVISLYICDYSVTGGTIYNHVSKLQPYQDQHEWKINVQCGDFDIQPNNISNVDFSISKPSDFYGEADVTVKQLETWEKQAANVSFDITSWDVPVGKSFAFELYAKINFTNNTYKIVKQTIYLIATNDYWEATILDENDVPVNNMNLTYSGEASYVKNWKIKFESTQEGYLPSQETLKLCQSSYINGNAIVIDREKPTISGNTCTFPLTVNYGGGDSCLHVGSYGFYIYFPITVGSYTIPIYSQQISLNISNDTHEMTQFNLSAGNSMLTTYKKTAGVSSDAWKITAPTDWKYEKTEFIHSSWTSEPSRTQNLHVQNKYGSDNEFYVYWDDKFCTNSDWYDIFDCNMAVYVKNDVTNEELSFIQPLTFSSLNYGHVLSECPYFVNALCNKTGESSNPWILQINSDSSINDQPTTFEIDYDQCALTKEQLWVEEIPNTNTAKLCWNGNIAKGYYPFTVKATSQDFFVTATSSLHFLCVTNDVQLVDVPDVINVDKGIKGELSKPISTFINGEKTEKAKYSLLSAPTGVTIDENTGLISWDGTTPLGSHEIVVYTSVEDEGYDPDTDYAIIQFIVTTEGIEKSNRNKIIIASVSTGVGAAGLGIGGTIAVQKLRTKKKHK